MMLFTLLYACQSLLWPPLKEGTYDLELVALVDDSCGYTEEDLGVGLQQTVDLSWDNEILTMSGDGNQGQYLWTGDGFEALGYSEVAVDDTCVLIIDATYDGQTFDRESFGLLEDMSLSVTGDCMDWDVSMMPCTDTLAWEGHLQQ